MPGSSGCHITRNVHRLLQAARGRYIPASAVTLPLQTNEKNPHTLAETSALPCFPLFEEHVGKISRQGIEPASPRDFHFKICQMIRGAKRRIKLASLYIGAASSSDSLLEKEFLDALSEASSRPDVNVTILLDANRALRKVSGRQNSTSSAEAVQSSLLRGQRKAGRGVENSSNGLYLFQALNDLKTLLPSPLNEVAGVFHIKAYIVDDSLILSGANLSEEYFDDRQDRYMLIENGGGGLVDFYSNLIEILCQYAKPYPDGSEMERKSKTELLKSLSDVMDGSNDISMEHDDSASQDVVVAYAVPTLQLPFASPLPFPSDVQVTRNLLLTGLEQDPASSIRLSSAYLNPTPSLMSVLARFGRVPSSEGTFGAAYLLTAGGVSHGFAPKKKARASHGSGRDWIPWVFNELTRDAAHHIIPNGGKVLFFERLDWTFHSKGLWLNFSSIDQPAHDKDPVRINDPQSLITAIVGSGNYGARSEELDIESNCILVLPSGSPLQESLAHEWNAMMEYSTEWNASQKKTDINIASFPLRAALPYIRNLF